MTLRNWKRVEKYEGENLNDEVDEAYRVFFNYKTGWFVVAGRGEQGYGVYAAIQDQLKPEQYEDTVPWMTSLQLWAEAENKQDSISEARKFRENNRAKIPRESGRYAFDTMDRDSLYDIAGMVVNNEFFATFWEIRFPRNVDRAYASEWVTRLMHGEDQLKQVADEESMEAYRKASEQV